MATKAENVSIWWRHHVRWPFQKRFELRNLRPLENQPLFHWNGKVDTLSLCGHWLHLRWSKHYLKAVSDYKVGYSTRLRFRSSDNIYIIQPRQDSIQIFQWRHMGVTASQIIRKSTVSSTVSLAQTKHQNSVLSAISMMIIIIIMMVLCEGNPPLTGVLPSQRASTQIAKFMGTTRGCWPRSVSPYGVTRHLSLGHNESNPNPTKPRLLIMSDPIVLNIAR